MTFKELIDKLNIIDGVSAYVYKSILDKPILDKTIDAIVSASDDDTFKEQKKNVNE